MADGNPYFDPYSGGVETSSAGMIPPLAVYRPGDSYDGANTDPKPSGYYADHYSHLSGHADGHSMNPPPAHGLPAVDSVPGVVPSSGHDFSPIPGMLTSSAGVSSMYGDGIANYSLKHEHRQHMPPTPPGSPDDPKDLSLHGMAGLGMATAHPNMSDPMSAAYHPLSKPVPMRRLSEKRITQAWANYGSVSTLSDPSMDGAMLGPSNAVAHAIAMTQHTPRRPRSEKKPIPTDMKDDKYFERRKRNNNAAKKSRDARKAREDEIAIRASFLEKENAILRAQVATLREEANSLRQLLLQKRSRP